jgi:hypothetical protein
VEAPMIGGAMPCMNCKAPTSEQDARLFAGVYVCVGCHGMATRLFERGQKELQQLLVMMQEAIRIGLVEGNLHFGEGKPEEISKQKLMQEIVRLADAKDAQQKK